jgi:alkylhydroperoxidase family enzyme
MSIAMFGYGQAPYLHSRLTLREFEAARIRTAEINGCMVCKTFRAKRDLTRYLESGASDEQALLSRGPAPDEAFDASITAWRSFDIYSDRERVAIELAERMGLKPGPPSDDEAFWQLVRALFDDAEIADLTLSIGGWMAAGRAPHALGLDTVCA